MNCIIYNPTTNRIRYFLLDCVQSGRNFTGSNGNITLGKRNTAIGIKWTNDIPTPITGDDGDVTGYVETADQLAEAATDRNITAIDRPDLLERLDHLRDMARITDTQIDGRIELVTDLAKAKVYLAKLTKETRDILRVTLWLLKGKV